MSKSGNANAASLERCVNCPRCGYLLDGLPLSGKCPECAFDYSPDIIVLYGSGTGRKKRVLWRNYFFWIGGLILFDVAIRYTPNSFRFAFWDQLSWIAFCLLMVSLYRYIARREMPGECQLLLTSTGFGLREGRGDVVLTNWESKYRIQVNTYGLFPGVYLIQITYPGQVYDRTALAFTFAASVATAERLRSRVESFRNAAVNGAPLQSEKGADGRPIVSQIV